jgi:hypothetical protein
LRIGKPKVFSIPRTRINMPKQSFGISNIISGRSPTSFEQSSNCDGETHQTRINIWGCKATQIFNNIISGRSPTSFEQSSKLRWRDTSNKNKYIVLKKNKTFNVIFGRFRDLLINAMEKHLIQFFYFL